MRRIKILNFAFSTLLILSTLQKSYSQIEASSAAIPPFDPVGLIENEFLGEGIEVLNITFEGEDKSVGYFTNGTSSVGIESGILLTTGVVESVGADIGVNEQGSVQANADNGSNVNDIDLDNLSSVSLFNMAKYTIEFIPSSDTLSFRYVFASEEYPEFVCSDYNDIFGFFISGPGISGPFQNGAINMALIPGTSSPVTINNVNGGVVGSQGTIDNCSGSNGSLGFSQYYVDNDGTSSLPVFDGWLTPFEAKVAVTPCETYTIKIVIADQGDPQRDSGVYLEAKSFGSEVIEVDMVTESIDGTIVEGCTEASVVLNLGSPRPFDTDINLAYFGDAVNGTDFELLTSTITIPAGQITDTISISAIEDGLPEGIEELQVAVQVNACRIDTFQLYFNDFELPLPILEDAQICPGGSVDLDGSIDVTIPNPVTIGSTNSNMVISSPLPGQTPSSVISTLDVVGIQPLQLGPGIIQSVCINIDHNRVEDLDIYLKSPGGQLIPLSTDNGGLGDNYTNTCFQPSAVNNITTGSAPFTGDWQPEGNWSDLWFDDSPLNGTWELEVIDDATGFSGILVDWEITFNPVFSLTYEWSPTTGLSCTDCPDPTATPTSTTTYTVVATDAFGCTVSDDATISIATLDFAEAGPDQNICPGGSATLTGSGGVSYEWSTSETTASITVSPTTTSTYTVTVTDSGGCTAVDDVQVIIGNSLGLDLDKTDITCFGENDGTITANPSGGQTPFIYSWSNGSSNATITGLTAQTYTVTVSDVSGCSATASAEILDQLPLVISMDSTSTCEGATDGTATINLASGGVAPISYLWDFAAGNQTTATATNLAGGTYSVTVTDNNNCTIVGTTTVESIDIVNTPTPTCGTITNESITFVWSDDVNAISFEVNVDNGGWITPSSNISHTVSGLTLGQSVTIEVRANGDCNSPIGSITCTTLNCTPINFTVQNTNDISCFGANDGSVSLLALGNNPPFIYTLNGDSNSFGIFNNLQLGSYVATVEDALGCTNSTNFTINEPDELIAVGEVINQPNCLTQGSATTIVTGGTYPYIFSWGFSQTDSIITGLFGGTYTVTVTDNNGCTTTASVDLTDYTPMTSILNVENLECSGAPNGSVEIIVQGGAQPLSYLWNDSQAQTTPLASGLGVGTYIVTVTDAIGCTIVQSAIVNTPNQLFLDSLTSSPALCFGGDGGSATVFTSGGNGNFVFTWSNSGNSASINNLIAGTYTVTVEDNNGCIVIDSVEVTEPTDLTLNMTPMPLTCFDTGDGMINVEVTGGTPDYSYIWNNNAGTEDLQNLEAGTYSLTVTDMNGCSEDMSADVIAPEEILLSVNVQSPDCSNPEIGSVEVTTNGGTPNYQYNWSNNITGTNLIDNLSAGTYTVTVIDNNNCLQTIQAIIDPVEDIDFDFEITSPNCVGEFGNISITPFGGEFPYDVSVGGNTFSNLFEWSNLPPGNYSIVLTDANGCTAEASGVVVEEASPIQVNLGPDVEINLGDSIQLVPIIGNSFGQLDYQWGSNDSTYFSCQSCPYPYAIPLQTTVLTLNVMDENGCIGQDEIEVFVDQERKVYIPNAFSPNDDGMNDNFTVYTRPGGHIEELQIFNRWGEKIFQKNDFEPNLEYLGWDGTLNGKKLNPAVFVYWVRVSFTYGPDEFYKGDVTLMR